MVAGLVVARQRPQTANGYVFVLMEDEHGQINVIVKPKIYERDRIVVRMEPFLLVRGRLQKDGMTTNVIAYEVRPLSPGMDTRKQPPTGGQSSVGRAPFEYLTALRASPPGIKNFG